MSLEWNLPDNLTLSLHDCPGFYLIVATHGAKRALLPIGDRAFVDKEIAACEHSSLNIFVELFKASPEVKEFMSQFSPLLGNLIETNEPVLPAVKKVVEKSPAKVTPQALGRVNPRIL